MWHQGYRAEGVHFDLDAELLSHVREAQVPAFTRYRLSQLRELCRNILHICMYTLLLTTQTWILLFYLKICSLKRVVFHQHNASMGRERQPQRL